jgi:hypothetical protein
MAKETKTRLELEALIIKELQDDPQCSDINAIVINRPTKIGWSATAVGDGAQTRPNCRQKISVIASKLAQQYDLDLLGEENWIGMGVFRAGPFTGPKPGG